MRAIDFVTADGYPANIPSHGRWSLACLRVGRQRLFAVPPIPVVIETNARIVRHVEIDATGRIQAGGRAAAHRLGFLKNFKQLPLIAGNVERSIRTRVNALRQQVRATEEVKERNEDTFAFITFCGSGGV